SVVVRSYRRSHAAIIRIFASAVGARRHRGVGGKSRNCSLWSGHEAPVFCDRIDDADFLSCSADRDEHLRSLSGLEAVGGCAGERAEGGAHGSGRLLRLFIRLLLYESPRATLERESR